MFINAAARIVKTFNVGSPEDSTKTIITSSSAVAKRPLDASCLSVVSFNSTKRQTESFIVSYIRYTDLPQGSRIGEPRGPKSGGLEPSSQIGVHVYAGFAAFCANL